LKQGNAHQVGIRANWGHPRSFGHIINQANVLDSWLSVSTSISEEGGHTSMWGSSRLNADLWKGNIGFARSQVLSHMGWIPSSMYKKGEKPSLRGHPVYLYETT